MKQFDLEHWPRREAYEMMSRVSQPFFSVTFTQDVTGLVAYTKAHGLSFYYALVYLATQAINEVEAFRLDIQNGQVVLLDRREPSFTDLKPGAEQFHIVTMKAAGTLEEFCREARRKSMAQQTLLDQEAEDSTLIYFSCLPWIEVTALTNERDFHRDDAIPRIAWGRYRKDGDRIRLNLAIEVNHRLIDGLHIGRFAEALTRAIEALDAEPVTN